MFRILRGFRINSLSDKRVGKYLLYALGEIFLVVLGILIALQINNWNEQKKTEEAEKVYLKRLLVDLRNDRNYLDVVYGLKKNKTTAADSILQYAFDGKDDAILALIQPYLTLVSWNAVIPNQNTFNEMISSGNLNLIQNDSIKNGLLQLDRNYKALIDWDEVVKQDAYISKFWAETGELDPYNYLPLNDGLSKALGLSDKWTTEQKQAMLESLKMDVSKVMNSNTFRSGVMSSRDDYQRQLTLVQALIDEVDRLIQGIEEELN